jgi:hypothetical protein
LIDFDRERKSQRRRGGEFYGFIMKRKRDMEERWLVLFIDRRTENEKKLFYENM